MQLHTGAANVGPDATSVGKRGSRFLDVGNGLHGSGAGSPVVRVGYVGDFPCIGRTLGDVHHRVAYRLMVRQPCMGLDGKWVYPPMAEAMLTAGLQEVETYVSLHQNTVA